MKIKEQLRNELTEVCIKISGLKKKKKELVKKLSEEMKK